MASTFPLYDSFKIQAERSPEKIALDIDDRLLSYQELNDKVTHFALHLLEIGIKKGDHIALWLPNSLEWVISLLALARIGAVAVPVNIRYKKEELQYVLQQSDSIGIIMQDEINGYRSLMNIFQNIPYKDVIIQTKICYSPENVKYEGFVSFSSLCHPISMLFHEEVTLSDPLIIQYTSGTTAFPKGVLLTHQNYVQTAKQLGTRQGITPEDRFFSISPFFHTSGSLHAIATCLLNGCTLISVSHFSVENAIQVINSKQCTLQHGTDILWIDLLNHQKQEPFKLPSMERVWTTGTPNFLKRIKETFTIPFVASIFGLTETTGNTAIFGIDMESKFMYTSVGKVLSDIEVRICDDEENEVKYGCVGEIWVKGYNIMREYYKKQEETNQILTQDGWLKTGDWGYLNEDGYLFYHGRKKDMIRVGGENVSPTEIENILNQHSSVKQAVAIPVPDDRLGFICAVAVIVNEQIIELETLEKELIAYCKERLASFKVPRKIWILDEFPLTATGKVKRTQLIDQLVQNDWMFKS